MGDQPVAVVNASGVFPVLSDHLNTPRQIIDTANNLRWNWGFSDPFGGNTPNNKPNASLVKFDYNLRFPGQYFDVETGLFYNYFRSYDPKVGRYTQSDPIGIAGGLNTFGYVKGNPLVKTDPKGEAALAPLGGLIGADIAIPDPSDVVPWKWVGYCVAITGAGAFDLIMLSRKGDFTKSDKKKFKDDNAEKNDGENRCEDCGKTVNSTSNNKGQPTPDDQLQIHHDPVIKDGGGRDSDGVVLCPPCHKLRHK